MSAGSEVIVARASGMAGGGARAVVRLSGEGLRRVLRGVVEPLPAGRGATAARLRLDGWSGSCGAGRVSLPVLVVWSEGPRSFTGEDSAEIVMAGGGGGGAGSVPDRVVSMLAALPGAREARPGEFSARAFMNGRLTLAQAEGVAAAISAGTEGDLAAARAALGGEQGAVFAGWAEEVAALLALVEAGVDFSDQEDVVPISPRRLHDRLVGLSGAMSGVLGGARGSERPDWLPRVVIEGPPNAGKSTLFNALLGRRRSMTSSVAGTTRDAIGEPLVLAAGGLEVHLVDLPGTEGEMGVTERTCEVDAAAQIRARMESARADVRLVCRAPHQGGFGDLSRAGDGIVRVRTKWDLEGGGTPVGQEGGADVIRVCAVDGRGLVELRAALVRAAWGEREGSGAGGGRERETVGGLLPRHRRALVRAMAHVEQVRRALGEADVATNAPSLARPEVAAAGLRTALDWLGELTGRMHPDAIIGRVFATFCVGK